MIQMIYAFCALINGGYYYEPHMVSKITASDGSVVENIEPRILKQVISKETSEKVRQYCEQVVYGANGTGSRGIPPGYRIGGKTGTAETVSKRGTRDKDEYVVSFMGYAPADDPQIAIYVVLNRPNSANQDLETRKAVVMSKNILTEILPYLNIFMTEPLTEEQVEELAQLDADIRQQMLDRAAQLGTVGAQEGDGTQNPDTGQPQGEDGAGGDTDNPQTGTDPQTGGDGESGHPPQDSGGDGQTLDHPEGSDPAQENNPYVNEDGQVIDPATGEVMGEDTEGYDTPVSGILGQGASGGTDPGDGQP